MSKLLIILNKLRGSLWGAPKRATPKVWHALGRPLILILVLALALNSCKPSHKSQTQSSQATSQTQAQRLKTTPNFRADLAYEHIKTQLSYGPRVPQTVAHDSCLHYISTTAQALGAKVSVQESTGTLYDGQTMPFQNIIVQFSPEKKRRVMLCTHWDTRPFADQENDESLWHTPIPGANDGASGVGILLEIARLYSLKPADVGLDLIFFDLEDWGAPQFASPQLQQNDSWCIGSTYWSQNLLPKDYAPLYGILLDMVGAPNATFYRERISEQYAPYLIDKVWNMGAASGYGSRFVNQMGDQLTDDHVPVNIYANIPCIDLIQFVPNQGFGSYWHTLQDDLQHIDEKTLKAVGQTLTNVLYLEK